MRSEIAKSFYEKQNDLPLRKAAVEKKSKWLKSWRIRYLALFSHKLAFTATENCKPQDSNVVFLGDIHHMDSSCKNPRLLKIDTTNGVFEVKFESSTVRDSWIEDISEACRTHKINKTQSPHPNECLAEKVCPNSIFCGGFQCL